MSESWKAFFYGAFDPKSTITIDKLAGSFLPQALSARIFGFHPWSLALPQVIEGVICVLVMYRVVRRWAGVVPGLLAAGIFTLTPIAASMFGHSMEDGALTMCLVLAADAYQRAVLAARLRSLVWAGAWVGLGFQAKMLEAWMILPALALGYLVVAPARLRRRLWQLGAAGVVMLAVSLSWIALYTFTPARDRPYVAGRPTTARSRWCSATTAWSASASPVPGCGHVRPRRDQFGGAYRRRGGGGRPVVAGGRRDRRTRRQAPARHRGTGSPAARAGPDRAGRTAPGRAGHRAGPTAPDGTGRTFTGSPGGARLTAGSASGTAGPNCWAAATARRSAGSSRCGARPDLRVALDASGTTGGPRSGPDSSCGASGCSPSA